MLFRAQVTEGLCLFRCGDSIVFPAWECMCVHYSIYTGKKGIKKGWKVFLLYKRKRVTWRQNIEPLWRCVCVSVFVSACFSTISLLSIHSGDSGASHQTHSSIIHTICVCVCDQGKHSKSDVCLHSFVLVWIHLCHPKQVVSFSGVSSMHAQTLPHIHWQINRSRFPRRLPACPPTFLSPLPPALYSFPRRYIYVSVCWDSGLLNNKKVGSGILQVCWEQHMGQTKTYIMVKIQRF